MFEVSCFIEVVVVELWIVDCASLVEVAEVGPDLDGVENLDEDGLKGTELVLIVDKLRTLEDELVEGDAEFDEERTTELETFEDGILDGDGLNGLEGARRDVVVAIFSVEREEADEL